MPSPDQLNHHKIVYGKCKGCMMMHATMNQKKEPVYTECKLGYLLSVCPIQNDEHYEFIRQMRYKMRGIIDEPLKKRRKRTVGIK